MKRILSVDDEPEILRCVSAALEINGYECITTTDQNECIELIKNDPEIALLTLDIKMPGKDGFELYNEIREIRHIPVLFVTGYSKSFTRDSDEVVKMWQEHFADGTTDIIYKPFDLEALFAKVDGLIGTADED